MLKRTLAASLLALSAFSANAAVSNVPAKVVRVLHVTDNSFGACMALLNTNPADKGLNCPTWVSFSCTGDFTTKDNAYRMYDMSQMAMALNKNVMVWLNDAKKHNGFCFAERIDVF